MRWFQYLTIYQYIYINIYTHILYTVYIYISFLGIHFVLCIYTHIDGWLAFDKAQMKTNPFKNASWHWCIGWISICCLQTYLADFCLAKTESPIWVDVLRSHAKTKCFFHNKNFTLREGIMLNHQRNSPLKWLNTTTRGTTGGTMAKGGSKSTAHFDSVSRSWFCRHQPEVFFVGVRSIYPGLRASLRKQVREELVSRCWGLNQSASS